MKYLFSLLVNYGGKIVCSGSESVEEIRQAKASDRFWVDENSFGFLWIPDIKLFPEKAEQVEFFEKWYPLQLDMPEHLRNPSWLQDKNGN